MESDKEFEFRKKQEKVATLCGALDSYTRYLQGTGRVVASQSPEASQIAEALKDASLELAKG
jgi:hypothetical protein